jgi:bacteriocin-like protein
MKELSNDAMAQIEGGYEHGTACGIAVGISIGAMILFGVVGGALTIGKALAVCAIDYGTT